MLSGRDIEEELQEGSHESRYEDLTSDDICGYLITSHNELFDFGRGRDHMSVLESRSLQ